MSHAGGLFRMVTILACVPQGRAYAGEDVKSELSAFIAVFHL